MNAFREGKFELLTLTETKLKGNVEIWWCGVNGIITIVKEMKELGKGVAILLKEVCHSAVIDFRCVNSRILWIKFKFSRVKICTVVGYGPNEGDGEERYRFWNEMDRILDRVWNGYRLCILRYLNGWVGDRTRVGMIGAFGVPRENDDGRKVLEFYV